MTGIFPEETFTEMMGLCPVRRYPPRGLVADQPKFYMMRASRLASFPEDPDQNSPDSNGIAARPLNNIDGVRMSTSLTYLSQARHRLNITIRATLLSIA